MKRLLFWQKTYLLTLLLFLAALFGGIGFIGWQNQQQMMAREVERIRGEQQFVTQSLAQDLTSIEGDAHLHAQALARTYGAYYIQSGVLIEVRFEGEPLFSNLPTSNEEALRAPEEADRQNWTTSSYDGEVLYVMVSSKVSENFASYELTCARSLKPLTDTWEQMQQTLLISSIFVSLIVAAGLFFVLRSLSRPLEKLTQTANRYAGGDLNVRAKQKGEDEIGKLAKSFNAMADTSVEQIAQMREVAEQNARIAANLSHEIRTPLTTIQGYAEYLRLADPTPKEQSSALDTISRESVRMQKISERMLQLTSLEDEELERKPCDLGILIKRTLRSAKPQASRAQVSLESTSAEELFILCDEVLMESMLANLLANAIKACSAQGSVSLSAQKKDERIVVEIRDTGRGLSSEELERLGEPFYRPDKTRSRKEGGAGLGVALCYQIAALHEAELTYRSTQGEGTTASLLFTAL